MASIFLRSATVVGLQTREADSRHDVRHKNCKDSKWLYNWHKSFWVDSQLSSGEAEVETVSSPVQSFGREAALQDVQLCRKLCQHGRIADAVDALNFLAQGRCRVDKNLLYGVLKRCIAQKDLVLGRRIHALSVESGYQGDAFLATHLIGLYASFGKLEDAMRVFTSVSPPSVHNWATIIFAYARHGEPAQAIRLYHQMRYANQGMGQEALRLYRRMQHEGINPPNSVTFVCLLQACASIGAGALQQGKQIHAQIEGLQDELVLGCSLVNMYVKCGSLEDARNVFERLAERNVATWTAMISGMCACRCGSPSSRKGPSCTDWGTRTAR